MKKDNQQICPIFKLEDWIVESHDVDTLCASFSCKQCVASPEDFGYNPDEPEETERELDESNYEIPF